MIAFNFLKRTKN